MDLSDLLEDIEEDQEDMSDDESFDEEAELTDGDWGQIYQPIEL